MPKHTASLAAYLVPSLYIDWQNPNILAKAAQLAETSHHEESLVKACFEFVRDHIKHSADYCLNPITSKASEVLTQETGFCYAKSHLLAALLRANQIPTGLCYQRLTIRDNKPPFCLHGLNAVYLQQHGWYRLDPRGNKAEVDAQFCPPVEKLAFPIIIDGEADLAEIWPEPLPQVTDALSQHSSYQQLLANLPDLPLIASHRRINGHNSAKNEI
ncbi:MAG: transglutaminase family protein [Cycloclasticus sp.]